MGSRDSRLSAARPKTAVTPTTGATTGPRDGERFAHLDALEATSSHTLGRVRAIAPRKPAAADDDAAAAEGNAAASEDDAVTAEGCEGTAEGGTATPDGGAAAGRRRSVGEWRRGQWQWPGPRVAPFISPICQRHPSKDGATHFAMQPLVCWGVCWELGGQTGGCGREGQTDKCV